MVSHVVVQTLPDPAFRLRPQSSEILAHYHRQSFNIQQQDDNIFCKFRYSYVGGLDKSFWFALIITFEKSL